MCTLTWGTAAGGHIFAGNHRLGYHNQHLTAVVGGIECGTSPHLLRRRRRRCGWHEQIENGQSCWRSFVSTVSEFVHPRFGNTATAVRTNAWRWWKQSYWNCERAGWFKRYRVQHCVGSGIEGIEIKVRRIEELRSAGSRWAGSDDFWHDVDSVYDDEQWS